jgi:hypothetical protein
LEELLAELIRYLQAQPGSRDEGDAHFVALKRIVEVHFAEQFDDFLLHPLCWRPRQSALRRAVNSYSEILAVEVDGQDDDYLLWDGIDIRKSYGSDSIDAGPDRQLIAMLIRERVVNAVVTTNWDGLIEETALAASATDRSIRLAVHMTNENFQTERGTAELNKIHGCAVLARQDPYTYHKYLISRLVDIAVWRADPDFQFVIQRSENLLQTRRSLFLGISVLQPFSIDCAGNKASAMDVGRGKSVVRWFLATSSSRTDLRRSVPAVNALRAIGREPGVTGETRISGRRGLSSSLSSRARPTRIG